MSYRKLYTMNTYHGSGHHKRSTQDRKMRDQKDRRIEGIAGPQWHGKCRTENTWSEDTGPNSICHTQMKHTLFSTYMY